MVADAGVAILNGADYDSWMARLIEASNAPDRVVLDVAELTGKKPGDNPHLWYDPASMPALAEALAKTLGAIDPDGAAEYEKQPGGVPRNAPASDGEGSGDQGALRRGAGHRDRAGLRADGEGPRPHHAERGFPDAPR